MQSKVTLIRHWVTLLLLCLTTSPLWAQTLDVKGKVTDANKEPLMGASVVVKGTTHGVSTDMDGNYSLNNVPRGATLEISYIGMVTQNIAVNGRSLINVQMKDENQQLEEVVIVGYGTQKKSSMTAAVSSVSAKEVQKQVTANVASALQGRTPGVEILQRGGIAGAEVNIVVRGAGSFGATAPLYVIDGAIADGLDALNPSDIESIEILKDGSAAAIYGSRAANGVVLVTTKNGKSGKTIVEVDASYSYQTPSKMLDMMNAEQWRTFANQVADNSPSYDRAPQNVNPTDPNRSTDWQDLYYRNAPMSSFNASVSGGGENSTFNTSLGYVRQEGIIIKSEYDKYNARINSTFKKGRFSLTEKLSIANTKKVAPPSVRTLEMPTIPVTDENGRYISTAASKGYSITNTNISNPLAAIYKQDAFTRNTSATGSLSGAFKLMKGLQYKLNVAGTYVNTNTYKHTPAYNTFFNPDGTPDAKLNQTGRTSLSEGRAEHFNYTIDNLLTFNRTFQKKHHFDVLLGTSWMRDFYRKNSISSGVNDLGAPTVKTYNGEGVVGSNQLNSALLSFFGRLNYDYNNKYLLSFSLRRDESSKFAKGHRVGYFPSASVGWNIHSEPWFDTELLSKLKLRASYGELGANFIDPYTFLNLAYGPVPAIFGSSRQYGYVTRFAQQDLTWETSITSNAAIEVGVLNNMLTFTAEYFIKRNNNLLAPLESLPSSGQTITINKGAVPNYNTASVENKGLEFSLEFKKKWDDFTLNFQTNLTYMQNKVLALGEGVQPIRGELMSAKFNDRPTITKEGLPIGTFWGYKVVGINDQGDFLYQAKDGTAKLAKQLKEDDKQVIGNPTPDFTFGYNLNLNYKNWDFTAFFQGVAGNEIFNAEKYDLYFNYNSNAPVDALNSWTPTNRNTKLPIAKTDNYNGGNALPSTFYIEDGSYLRLKNVQIGYTFPETLLKKIGGLRSLRIYGSAQNLFTLTNYSLYDPEVSSNALFNKGIDGLEANAPAINARVYNMGLKLTF